MVQYNFNSLYEGSMLFTLPKSFTDQYRVRPEPFGFGLLGRITYYRTYARPLGGDKVEAWADTCERVVNGMYSIQKEHCINNGRPWSDDKAMASAKDAYDRLFNLKWSPSGRGLWMSGTDFLLERKIPESMFNCAFVSTEDMRKGSASSFEWAMNMLMLGVGVGFDTAGEGAPVGVVNYNISSPSESNFRYRHVIPDSREGWAESLAILIESFIGNDGPYIGRDIVFDYSELRPAGARINGFGGVSSGAAPLIELHQTVRDLLWYRQGHPIRSRDVVDIMNAIGRAVIAGNVRRSALIALGNPKDQDFVNLKRLDLPENEYRKPFYWASNNSVYAELGMDYSPFIDAVMENGEPGFVWNENVQNNGRMNGSDHRPDKAIGWNPCQPADATVVTKDGLSTIGQIEPGDFIWSNETWTRVVAKYHTGVKPVYAYRYDGGTFIGTEEHRVVTELGKREVRDASSVMRINGNVTHPMYGKPGIENTLWEIDGAFIAAGTYKDDLPRIVVTPGLVDANIGASRTYRIGQVMSVNTSITQLELESIRHGRIPSRLLNINSSMALSLLRGYIAAMGRMINGELHVATNNDAEYDYITALMSLFNLQFISTLSAEERANMLNNPGMIDLDNWFRVVASSGAVKKALALDYPIRTDLSVAPRYGRLLKKTYLGNMDVYDITVDNVSHTYWSGGLNVSNCGEIPLENQELCNLVELYPNRHESLYDFLRTIKYAYLYGKSVALMNEYMMSPTGREVATRNRRIGLSMTGIAQFTSEHGVDTMRKWMRAGYDYANHYDMRYSEWFGVPRSVRITTTKPSGTVSLLAGATPGVHYPHSEYYIRRIRLSSNSYLVERLRAAGVHVEEDTYSPNTVVAEIPIHSGHNIKRASDLSIWEQLEMAAFTQENWSDNSVSVTVSVDPKKTTREDMMAALNLYQYRLKSVSFLPVVDGGAYAQMPYEEIDRHRYEQMMAAITPELVGDLADTSVYADKQMDLYCDGDACVIPSA